MGGVTLFTVGKILYIFYFFSLNDVFLKTFSGQKIKKLDCLSQKFLYTKSRTTFSKKEFLKSQQKTKTQKYIF